MLYYSFNKWYLPYLNTSILSCSCSRIYCVKMSLKDRNIAWDFHSKVNQCSHYWFQSFLFCHVKLHDNTHALFHVHFSLMKIRKWRAELLMYNWQLKFKMYHMMFWYTYILWNNYHNQVKHPSPHLVIFVYV